MSTTTKTSTVMAPSERSNGMTPETISINGNASQPLRSAKQESSRESKKYKHTFAVHAEGRTSCLSHDADTAPSFLGFRNLMGLVLVVSNLRLMIENFKKYGILVTLSGSNISPVDWRWAVFLYFLTPCHLFGAYVIELLAANAAKDVRAEEKRNEDEIDVILTEQKKKTLFSTWRAIAIIHALNATSMLVFATWIVYYKIHNPGIGVLTQLHSVVVWLKVCSYALTNRDLRHAMLNKHEDPTASPLPALYKTCPYPQNITVKNLSYFWWAPTLVYQPVYPMNTTRRWSFIFKRMAEFFLLSVVIWLASAQYAVPLLRNSLASISTLNLTNILERVLKLSTISLVCWLAGFFALFQSFLNGLAEIMYFADREFYGDWWNTTTVRSYWTSWNKPVTHFMKRHIYAPMVGRGVPPTLAQIITFLFSGVLHELLIGVPTHNILGFAFFGMVGQLPLIFLTDPFRRWESHNAKLVGNLIFWLSFCVFGQPLAAIAYFFAWQAKYGTESRPAWPSVT